MKLLESFSLGPLSLKNRVIMAPLTRCRAEGDHVPTPLMAEYYAQRASAGLIVAEATMVMPFNSAFISEPGIYSEAQVAGWRQVTEAVHRKGGLIFLQIWHGGRACHPDLNQGRECVAPSAVAIEGETHTRTGKVPYVTPRALRLDEIPGIVSGFRKAAENAKLAGFDGVEVHGANGYLLDEFLRASANQRTDPYGGSIENRARLLLEVVDAAIGVWGAHRVGVRISPLNSFNSMSDPDPVGVTSYVSTQLNQRKALYLHLMRGDFFGVQKADVVTPARECFRGALIGNMGYTPAEAESEIQSGRLDAVAFGHHYVSNPDLVERIKAGIPFTEPEVATYYSPGAKGYTDYPRAT